ncbi:glycosyltransferase [Paenibacillus sp. FSL K6-1217]|uniref:glycosyltransferase n=1 Tax=Paenibacillus sp. FSL K6-1217 TaxID=2921466 RepID=UPI00324905A9
MKANVPLISLCMIVKDEESWIGRCLSSVRQGVDEIIVVDTGSRDRTMDVAHGLGAKILQYPWKDSFAEARNYSLRHATGEWVLWMDADEEIAEAEAVMLRQVDGLRDSKLVSLETVHFSSPFRPRPDEAYRLEQCRLFRNGEGIQFTGDIHEQLSLPGQHAGEASSPPIRLPVRLFHYGYLESVTSLKSKHERNLKLLQQSVSGHPNPDPWSLYHIASEYQRTGEYASAFQQVNLAIAASLRQNRLPPSLFYKLKYSCLVTMGSFREGWPGIDKAISLYPDYVDLHLYKGCILMNIGQVEAAISAFEHCLDLGENALHNMVLSGAGTFYPCYYMGNCYEMCGMPVDAEIWYRRALHYSPGFIMAAEKLAQLKGKVIAEAALPSGFPVVFGPSLRQNPPPQTPAPQNTWTLAVLLRKEDGPRSALHIWAEKWKPLADDWIIIAAGVGGDAATFADELEGHVLHLSDDEDPFQLWKRMKEDLTTPYVLWLNPYEDISSDDLETLAIMKNSNDMHETMFTLNLCWQAGEIDRKLWRVRRNRLAHREAILGCNPVSGEFVAIPGILNQSISITLLDNKNFGQYQDNNHSVL